MNLKELLFHASNELVTLTRINFYQEKERQSELFLSKVQSSHYYGIELIDTLETYDNQMNQYKAHMKKAKSKRTFSIIEKPIVGR